MTYFTFVFPVDLVCGMTFDLPNNNLMFILLFLRQVRVYDPSAPQRRPVLEAQFGEYPLTALSLTANQTVVVGNSHGELAILDLRKGE